MSFPGFNDPWYAEIIERFSHDTRDEETINAAIDGLGRCLLAASCIIAQEIESHTKALKALALALETVAEELERPPGDPGAAD